MQISEIYRSIQGEGRLTGVPSTFVRVSGCNLRCVWCDTPYASWEPEGVERSPEDVASEALGMGAKHVVVTGGEPMIFNDVVALTERLREGGAHVTVETAGTVFRDVACDLASVSPKLSNSTPRERDSGWWADRHEATRINVEVVQRFVDRYDYQLKFVVDRAEDLDEIETLLGRLTGVDRLKVLLMPEGVTAVTLAERGRWLAELCVTRGFRFCPRLHVMMYGNVRGV